jgi:hypothetical protein
MIGETIANDGAGHPPDDARRLVLGDDLAAMLADEAGTGKAVLAHAGQNDGAQPAPLGCCEAAQHGIDRRSAEILGCRPREAQAGRLTRIACGLEMMI